MCLQQKKVGNGIETSDAQKIKNSKNSRTCFVNQYTAVKQKHTTEKA
jgi:hypothetical protein